MLWREKKSVNLSFIDRFYSLHPSQAASAALPGLSFLFPRYTWISKIYTIEYIHVNLNENSSYSSLFRWNQSFVQSSLSLSVTGRAPREFVWVLTSSRASRMWRAIGLHKPSTIQNAHDNIYIYMIGQDYLLYSLKFFIC